MHRPLGATSPTLQLFLFARNDMQELSLLASILFQFRDYVESLAHIMLHYRIGHALFSLEVVFLAHMTVQ